eukprot:538012-Amphidinium_carterae.1
MRVHSQGTATWTSHRLHDIPVRLTARYLGIILEVVTSPASRAAHEKLLVRGAVVAHMGSPQADHFRALPCESCGAIFARHILSMGSFRLPLQSIRADSHCNSQFFATFCHWPKRTPFHRRVRARADLARGEWQDWWQDAVLEPSCDDIRFLPFWAVECFGAALPSCVVDVLCWGSVRLARTSASA